MMSSKYAPNFAGVLKLNCVCIGAPPQKRSIFVLFAADPLMGAVGAHREGNTVIPICVEYTNLTTRFVYPPIQVDNTLGAARNK